MFVLQKATTEAMPKDSFIMIMLR